MTTLKIKVRSQYDHRLKAWKIVKKTYNGGGGWANFSISKNNCFASMQLCDKAVDELVKMYGGIFEIG